METKNIIAAISLSAAVIIIYSLFFAPSQDELNKIRAEKEKDKIVKNSEAPSLDNEKNISTISRNDAIQENQRINFENKNIIGSISLTGSAIDDLTFKNYSKILNGKEKVTLLNPRKVKNGYYIETGWVTNNKNIDLPNSKTNWRVDGICHGSLLFWNINFTCFSN